jgi:hypothetical protein
MTRHGSTARRSESLVLPAAMLLALVPRPIAPATLSSLDPALQLRCAPPPGATFRHSDPCAASRCARRTTERKPKSP